MEIDEQIIPSGGVYFNSEPVQTLDNGLLLNLCLPVDTEIEFFVILGAKCDDINCVMGITLEDDLLNIYAQDLSSAFPDANAHTKHQLFWRGKLAPDAMQLNLNITAATMPDHKPSSLENSFVWGYRLFDKEYVNVMADFPKPCFVYEWRNPPLLNSKSVKDSADEKQPALSSDIVSATSMDLML